MATYQTRTNVMTEFAFMSQAEYADPYNDIELDVQFTGAGREIIVPAFWAGENVWKVRFAPPSEGTWSYHTFCSNMDDTGLCGQTGSAEAAEYDGENPLLKHGRLRVAPSGRDLC